MSFDLKTALAGHLDQSGKVPFVGNDKSAPRPTLERPLVFRHYRPDRTVLWRGRVERMGTILNAALPAWHPCSMLGTPFSSGSAYPADRPFVCGGGWLGRSTAKVDGLCQIAEALGIPNITFHAQVDVVDEVTDNVLETGERLEHVLPVWRDRLAASNLKVLWGTANQFSHPSQVQGSATSPCPDTFELTAVKQKHALDFTAALGGQLFIIWDGQGGEFDAIISRPEFHEERGIAMLHKVVDYAASKGIKVAIEPKPFEPSMGQDHRDVRTTLGILRKA
ncbi:MAG: hypothetical protein KDD69_12445, partial [Bdellovibrionales bacterium]|nr:hypothetical protein [Bdellovibrionales bacterium]